jgi:ABC-type branched-subunit amino acid transport system permease subunit
MYRIVRSPFGKVIQVIRDNPVRAAAIGVDVRLLSRAYHSTIKVFDAQFF